ncbi:restriction endonuclease subunit S [Aquabacterium sp. OR-4]|uniref:restriction endonuclease subunit S n=1 Tax=Aquabacterium sp. OR-4 TaxID=2978127 RepID=UPI0021B480AD|nr:restriction endonuclease subunit S [Aquabacterium sp. OR-4]MDT7834790.1 restriction endonuclease subunit S [Aquabacterium sp. OR-4]
MSELPSGWTRTTAAELFERVTSGSRGWAKYYANTGAAFIRVGNLDHDTIKLDLADVQRVEPPAGAEGERTRLMHNDLLVSITAELGMVGLVPRDLGEAYINQHIALARPRAGCDPRFLAWYFASEADGKRQLLAASRGGTKAGLGLDDIRDAEVLVAPFPEQQRIANKLDAILARVDACRNRLDRVGPLLQRFRQSVLARAVSGGVGDQQYDISEWTPCAIGQLGVVVTGNTPARVRASDPNGRIPLFKPTDLSQGDAVCQSDERLTDEGVSGARLLPTGAVLVTCIGATIGKTGLAAVPCATNQQINAVVCDESRVDPRYLYLWFSSPIGQQAVIGNASATTLPIINKSKFASLQVLLPPLAVQRDIAGRVSMLLEQAGRLQRRLDGAAATIHRLAPATLAKAFRGELVPQDPNDEPAAEMLARLDASAPPKTTARRGRSTA